MEWQKPALADAYTAWPTSLQQNIADLAKMLDGVTLTGTTPTGAIRWSSANARFEKWNGTAWVQLVDASTNAYAIRAANSDQLNGQAASFYLDAGNMAAGVLAAARGGTGNGTYAVGDILYASTTSALSRLAGVATGNALLSGGVGTAPAWGKVGLTTHVTGTLPVGNGGTGLASLTTGALLFASSTSAVGMKTIATLKTDLALTKADVGLGNVDNTSDANKPVSTATQTALDAKAPLSLVKNIKNQAYTLVLTDNNDYIYKTDGVAYAWTVPPNSSVAFPEGAMITLVNDGTAGNITITQGAGVTIQLAGGTTTGNRTLVRGGVATLLKVGTDKWFVSGAGVS